MFIDRITGYYEIEIIGNNLENVLYALAEKNVNIRKIRKYGKNIRMRVSLSNYRAVRNIISGFEYVSCKIINVCGVVPWLKKHRMRSGFVVGFILLIFFICLMFSLIWSVDISGTYSVSETEVLECLRDCGIYPGAFIAGNNLDLIRLELMRKFDNIAYVTLNFVGSRFYVEIEESVLPPNIVDNFDFCNIIASRDGVLIECNTYQGRKQVKAGDAVRKGDMLVNGIYPSKVIGYRLVRSDAEMIAYTRHDFSVFIPFEYEVLTETGKISNKYAIKLFNFLLDVPFTGTDLYQFYDINTEEIKLTVSDIVFPVSLISEERKELEKTVCFISESEAEILAKEQLDEKMRIELFGLEVVSVSENLFVSESGVTVSRCCTVIENIAERSPILRETKKK